MGVRKAATRVAGSVPLFGPGLAAALEPEDPVTAAASELLFSSGPVQAGEVPVDERARFAVQKIMSDLEKVKSIKRSDLAKSAKKAFKSAGFSNKEASEAADTFRRFSSGFMVKRRVDAEALLGAIDEVKSGAFPGLFRRDDLTVRGPRGRGRPVSKSFVTESATPPPIPGKELPGPDPRAPQIDAPSGSKQVVKGSRPSRTLFGEVIDRAQDIQPPPFRPDIETEAIRRPPPPDVKRTFRGGDISLDPVTPPPVPEAEAQKLIGRDPTFAEQIKARGELAKLQGGGSVSAGEIEAFREGKFGSLASKTVAEEAAKKPGRFARLINALPKGRVKQAAKFILAGSAATGFGSLGLDAVRTLIDPLGDKQLPLTDQEEADIIDRETMQLRKLQQAVSPGVSRQAPSSVPAVSPDQSVRDSLRTIDELIKKRDRR